MDKVRLSDVKLMGAFEIQQRLGVSRHRTYVLVNRKDFPDPRWSLAMGKVWYADDVEAWIAEHRPNLDDPEEQP